MTKRNSGEKFGICSYCGKEGQIEDEHVVPTCLFTNDNQSRIVINACPRCNDIKLDGEDDLREYLLYRAGIYAPEVVWKLVLDKLKPAASKGFSKLARVPKQERKNVLYESTTGVLYQMVEMSVPDPLAIDTSLCWMVRGLYFHEYGKLWPEDGPLRLKILNMEHLAPLKEEFQKQNPDTSRKPMGKHVFWYLPVEWPEQPDIVSWLMVFYESVGVVAITGIPEEEGYFDYLVESAYLEVRI